MARLSAALPETVAAAQYVRGHAGREAARIQSADLLQALALIENNFTAGGPAVSPGLLRDLVIAVTTLTGRVWLRANETVPEVAAFLSLHTRPEPPALPVLDRIISDLLGSRFGHHSAVSAA